MTAPDAADMPDTAEALSERIVRCFKTIEAERMAGLPFLNGNLDVELVGLSEWQDGFLGILITPWFLNIIYLRNTWEGPAPLIGEKRMITFPSGTFEFIGGHEDSIGSYLSCSLFSPVHEFQDQETARAAAQASMAEILSEDPGVSAQEKEMAQIWRGELPEKPPRPTAEESFDQPSSDDEQDAPKVPISQVEVSRRRFISAGRAREPQERLE